jgi:hypothetical protein
VILKLVALLLLLVRLVLGWVVLGLVVLGWVEVLESLAPVDQEMERLVLVLALRLVLA